MIERANGGKCRRLLQLRPGRSKECLLIVLEFEVPLDVTTLHALCSHLGRAVDYFAGVHFGAASSKGFNSVRKGRRTAAALALFLAAGLSLLIFHLADHLLVLLVKDGALSKRLEAGIIASHVKVAGALPHILVHVRCRDVVAQRVSIREEEACIAAVLGQHVAVVKIVH